MEAQAAALLDQLTEDTQNVVASAQTGNGGGKIVHVSNSKLYPAGGIKISSPWNYRTVLGVRRYW